MVCVVGVEVVGCVVENRLQARFAKSMYVNMCGWLVGWVVLCVMLVVG